MQYSDTSGLQGIIQDIDFRLGTDSTQYSVADKTRNVNARYSEVWTMIFQAYGGWTFMDDNIAGVTGNVTVGSNDGPYADQDIVSGTGLYALPTGTLTVKGVSVKQPNNGTWGIPLVALSYDEFIQKGGDAFFQTSTGVPWAYMLQGDVVRLLPAPNYSQSVSLRVWFDQDISNFAVGDTTKVPGFASPFHNMLSIGAALDYAIANTLQKKAANLASLWTAKAGQLASFYEKRWKNRWPGKISPQRDLVDEFS